MTNEFLRYVEKSLNTHIALQHGIVIKTFLSMVAAIGLLMYFQIDDGEYSHIGVIWMFAALAIGIYAIRIRSAYVPLTADTYLPNGEINNEMVHKRTELGEGDIEITIRSHLKSMYQIERENERYAKCLNLMEVLILTGVILEITTKGVMWLGL